MERKIATIIGFLVIFLVVAPAAWAAWTSWQGLIKDTEYSVSYGQIKTKDSSEDKIDFSEKEKIDIWIEENNLNEYGDPSDTVYAGGTPLFDEKTGQTIDKYEYILTNHPDRPWND